MEGSYFLDLVPTAAEEIVSDPGHVAATVADVRRARSAQLGRAAA